MRLADLLDRSEALEQRAAAVYRSFAVARRDDPVLAALWTALAAEEDAHARTVLEVRSRLSAGEGVATRIEGCEEALSEVAQRLRHAEDLGPDATADRQFAAALDLELSELETLRRLALEASHSAAVPPPEDAHLRRLADAALRRSRDDHVRLGAALLLARARLAADDRAAGRR